MFYYGKVLETFKPTNLQILVHFMQWGAQNSNESTNWKPIRRTSSKTRQVGPFYKKWFYL